MGILQKLFGTYSEREVKRILPIQQQVLDLEEKYRGMSDAELKAVTPALKARLAAGETLDDILPDAFAACREASDRVLGMRHFPVQCNVRACRIAHGVSPFKTVLELSKLRR